MVAEYFLLRNVNFIFQEYNNLLDYMEDIIFIDKCLTPTEFDLQSPRAFNKKISAFVIFMQAIIYGSDTPTPGPALFLFLKFIIIILI